MDESINVKHGGSPPLIAGHDLYRSEEWITVTMRFFTVVILFLLVVIIIGIACNVVDPDVLLPWWNEHLRSICLSEDRYSYNGIPSYQDAWNCTNSTIRTLHSMISLNHNDILAELNLYFDTLECYEHDGQWSKFIIKDHDTWNLNIDKLPILKKIITLCPDVRNLSIALCNPGSSVINQRERYKYLQRYYYGLWIPHQNNNDGFAICGREIGWNEGSGFMCDPTRTHSMWNHSADIRIIIIADVFRNLGPMNYFLTRIIDNLVNVKYQLQQPRDSRGQQSHKLSVQQVHCQ